MASLIAQGLSYAALAATVALSARGEETTPSKALTPSLAETSVIINLYDLQRDEVLQKCIDALAPLVRPQDVFLLVSGNNKGSTDIEIVADWAKRLHERFPKNDIWTLTSGMANVKALAAARGRIPTCVSTIIYDYEPKWANEPEFDADFSKTIANFTEAAKIAHAGGFKFGGAPTGRPLLQASFAGNGWDYGKLAKASGADGMVVQTQTYCKKGLESFKEAMAKLKAQQTGAGLALERVYPQVTVEPNAGKGNGVPAPRAVECIREARAAGFSRVTLWFAPSRVENAVEFLKNLKRKEIGS